MGQSMNELNNIKKQNQLKEIWRRYRKNPSAVIGMIVLALFILVAICADLIMPYDLALKQVAADRLQGPSAAHWFGTDGYGRDMFARVIHGSRNSLLIGFAATLIALALGWVIGAIAGYCGNKIDNAVMRVMDAVSAIPMTIMALAIVSALGTSTINLILAISIARMPAFVRMVRASILGIIDQEYVEAARAGGASDLRILLTHLTPNISGTLIVQTTMTTALLIRVAASLSFLGLGIQAPAPEWGTLLSEAREFMRISPYLMIFPGLAIVLSTLAMSLMGDGLRDALDPRLKT